MSITFYIISTLAQLFFNAAQAAQEKITSVERKLWPEPTG